ncbi:hypothetical protein ACFY0F_36095, partial [Streptomyces sp. NPDC001544]|uniref:hypothetical protein n=1 Tax=Streptomyces sp. NPDC001544 TaxID=3364584 RepID=UPI00368272BE
MPEFEAAELDYEFARESANVVNVERPTSESEKACGKPADRESEPKGSDKVGSAGKGNRESGKPGKHRGNRIEKRSDRVGNARP